MYSLKRRVDRLEKELNCEAKGFIVLSGDSNSDWGKLKEEYIKQHNIDPENIGTVVRVIDKFVPEPE